MTLNALTYEDEILTNQTIPLSLVLDKQIIQPQLTEPLKRKTIIMDSKIVKILLHLVPNKNLDSNCRTSTGMSYKIPQPKIIKLRQLLYLFVYYFFLHSSILRTISSVTLASTMSSLSTIDPSHFNEKHLTYLS